LLKNKKKLLPLLPMVVFVFLYFGLGITFEYVMKIKMGFYNVPIVVIFMISLFVACIQNKKLSFNEKLSIMGKGIGDKNIITMILVFLVSGVFVGVTKEGCAQSVAYFLLSIIPYKMAVAALFIISCLVSIGIGTSVGTITLLTPIGITLASTGNFSVPLCIASVVGGAMFGDNLSFISDTTIAACNGQGCQMKDKFKENLKIALPAAIVSLILILIISFRSESTEFVVPKYNLIHIIPYIIVLIGGIRGVNVFLVLISGIISASLILLMSKSIEISDLLSNMGKGAQGMFTITIITILVSAICSLIKEYGGFDALLHELNKLFVNNKTTQIGLGILVSIFTAMTANNTVGIVLANPLAKEIAKNHEIKNTKVASLLDIFACVTQGSLPYGAQILMAISIASDLGSNITAFQIIPNLFYPFILLVFSLFFILRNKSN